MKVHRLRDDVPVWLGGAALMTDSFPKPSGEKMIKRQSAERRDCRLPVQPLLYVESLTSVTDGEDDQTSSYVISP